MTSTAFKTLFLALLMVSSSAFGDAQLKVNADLIVHPSQVRNLFGLTSDHINTSSQWEWPELEITKPYKTKWANVKARGPFVARFATERLSEQVLSFEFEWAQPELAVGQFLIQDKIIRDEG